jgi:zinc protease
MLRTVRLAASAAFVLTLAGCSAIPFMHGGKTRTAPTATPSAETAARGKAPALNAKVPGRELKWGPGPVVFEHPYNVWPQTYSDLTPDPNVRFGTLPNGMRYALMHNATPKGQAAVRLRFDAGSLMEHDNQQGLAHFLEHMAFNGSKNVPEGDMVKILERLGLAFGADTNASTDTGETIYQLDLPRTDDETVDTALMLFRETASNLTVAQDAMDRERGVVLSEERGSDTPPYRIYKQQLAFQLGDHIATKRFPIGLADTLRTAPNKAILDFYHDYYRPERATLIMVGDFDVAKMKAKIEARFGDWKPDGKAGAEPPLTLPLKRGPDAKIVVIAGAPQMLTVSWISPPDLRPDTRDKRRRDIVDMVAFAALNRRLERIARGANPPFISANAGHDDQFHSAEITALQFTVQPGKWQDGLSAIVAEQRRAAQFGVSQAEIDREVENVRTMLKTRVAGMSTRKTTDLAEELTYTLNDGIVETNPQQDAVMFDEDAKAITMASVNAALSEAFTGSGPLVFMSSPTQIEGGEPALKAAMAVALSSKITAGEAQVAKTWPYASGFGKPGKIAEQTDAVDLETTFVRFENGVRLTIKPTKFRDDQILITARIGSGRLAMPTDRITAAWAAGSVYTEGGLKTLTAEDIEQIMTSHVVGADLGIGDDAFALSGGTTRDDLKTQMQLMTAYVVDPGWRPEPFERMKSYGSTLHDQQDATAGGVMGRELGKLLRSGDTRWAFPSRAEIAASKASDVRSLLESPLANGPIEVTIVGDTTVEKAIAAVAETFGALPPRPTSAWTAPPPAAVNFPAVGGEPVVLTHKGRADQAVGLMAWRTEDFFTDMGKARIARILGDVLELRMIEELREKQGATYSPSASASASSVFPHYGFVIANIETNPDKIDGFFRDTETIAASLRDTLITQDELDRAKKPAIEALTKNMESNEFWMGQLQGSSTDPRKLTAMRSALAGIQRVTAADVQAAAREILAPGKSWKLVVKPEATAAK